jgi:hypothetical protein
MLGRRRTSPLRPQHGVSYFLADRRTGRPVTSGAPLSEELANSRNRLIAFRGRGILLPKAGDPIFRLVAQIYLTDSCEFDSIETKSYGTENPNLPSYEK